MRRISKTLAIAVAAALSLLQTDARGDVVFDRQRGASGVAEVDLAFSYSGLDEFGREIRAGGGGRRFGTGGLANSAGVLNFSGSGAFGGVVGSSNLSSTTTFSGGVLSASGNGSTATNAHTLPGDPEEHFNRFNRGQSLSLYQLDFQVMGEPEPYSFNTTFSKSPTTFSTSGDLDVFLQGPGGFVHRLKLDSEGADTGSLAPMGMLNPGGYEFHVSAEAGSSFGDHDIMSTGGPAMAQYNFSFSVGEPTPHVLWINEGSGSFRTADNWSTDAIPDAQSVAIFDLNQVYTVDLGGVDSAIDRAFVHQGLVALDNGTLRLTNASAQSPSLMVGVAPGETAILQFLSGSALSSVNAVVGATAGSRGTVSFDEVGAWVNSGQLVVGRGGRGELLLDRTSGHVATGELVVGKDITGNGRVDITTGSAAEGPGLSTGRAVIGAEGFGELLVRTGGLVRTTATAELGSLGANSHGLVFVDGRSAAGNKRSTWEVADTLTIGGAGEGDLDITAGGIASGSTAVVGSAAGSRGSVLVEGNPAGADASSWINTENVIVGVSGQADVRVLDGGLVVSQNATIGGEAGSQGAVTISGVNTIDAVRSPSQWGAIGRFTVGRGGSGELTIEDGGKVQSASARIGELATPAAIGIATVRGMHDQSNTRSTWEVNQLLEVGAGGRGLLQILDGGMVTCAGAIVGAQSSFVGATGTLTIRGAAPGGEGVVSGLIVNDALAVGLTGTGFVNVEAGGALRTQSASIGGLAASTGIVEVRGSDTATGIGSQWLNAFELNIGVVGPGTLIVANGGGVRSDSVRVGPAGAIRGDGTLLVPQANRVVENGGVIEPGLSPGKLTIEGNYVQLPAGKLVIEAAGTSAGQFDVLKVTGNATIGGKLMLEFLDGIAPRQGDALEFLDVTGTLGGQFADVEVRNLAPAFQFDLRPDAGGLTMVALNDGVFVPPPPSVWNIDANGNWSSAGNWTVDVPNDAGAVAVFASKITASRTVTADEPITVARIDFDSANAYTIAGSDTITLNTRSSQEQVNVISGSHTISAPVTLADNTTVTVTPTAGNLSIAGALSASGVNLTKAGAGTLIVNNLRSAGLSVDGGTVVIAPNGGLTGTSGLGGLNIAGTNDAWTAKLDLSNNAAVIQSSAANKAIDLARLHNQVKHGFNNGTWTGQGITSSTAAANTDADTGLTVVDNALLGLLTFSGQPVTADSILLKYTYYGDIDQNGQVDADDLTVFASNFGRASGATQVDGDIDFNGAVNADDLTVFANNFNKGVGNPLVVADVQAVPEPQTIGLLVVGLAALIMVALGRIGRVGSSAQQELRPPDSDDARAGRASVSA